MAVDGNGRQVYLDPYRGSLFAVAAAARRLACAGAEPLGITDGLNFGNPEKPEIFWQFRQSVEGISAACRALELPVVGGNVSFYNEVGGEAIYPTPVVGAVGLLEDPERWCGAGFSRERDLIYLLGAPAITLGGSQFLKFVHGKVAGALPQIDLVLEKRLQMLLRRLIREGLLGSAHSIEDGGLAVALAESCLRGGRGAAVTLPESSSPELLLFGEGPSRVAVSVEEGGSSQRFEELAREAAVPAVLLGRTGGASFTITAGEAGRIELPLAQLQQVYGEAFPWPPR